MGVHDHGDGEDDDLPALIPNDAASPGVDNDDMPALVTSDESDNDSVPEGEFLLGEGSEHDLLDEEDYGDEDVSEDEDDYEDRDLLPELVAVAPGSWPGAGPNVPLDLDQQAAVDDLSHELDSAEALAASVRLVSFKIYCD